MTDTLLDLANIATNIAFTVFFVGAILIEWRATLANLIRACQWYWTGVALAVLAVVIDVASVPYDGWWRVALSGSTVATSLTCAVLTDRKRDRMVVAEMQRQVEP